MSLTSTDGTIKYASHQQMYSIRDRMTFLDDMHSPLFFGSFLLCAFFVEGTFSTIAKVIGLAIVLSVTIKYIQDVVVLPRNPKYTQQKDNKFAVFITGTSGGIGLETVKMLLAKNLLVFATVRKDADIAKLPSHSNLVPVICDVTKQEQVDAAVQQVREELQARNRVLHALVNNAGFSQSGPLELITFETMRRQMDVNVGGQVAMTNALLPLLRECSAQEGDARVIFTGSQISTMPCLPTMNPYVASKHAMEAVAKGYALELKHWNIKSIIVAPGGIKTPFYDTNRLHLETSARKQIQASGLEGTSVGDFYYNTIKNKEDFKVFDALSDVVNSMERAVLDRSPRLRYKAGKMCKILTIVMKFLPDDLVVNGMGKQYIKDGLRN